MLRQYLSGKLKEKVNSSSLLIYFKNLTITVRSAFFPFSDSLVNEKFIKTHNLTLDIKGRGPGPTVKVGETEDHCWPRT